MHTLPRYGYNSAKKVGRLGRSMGRSSIARSLKTLFHVYCKNTGLHGFRYIVTSGSRFERMIWFAVCVAAIFFCLVLMLRLWDHYSNNPTVTIIDTSNPIKDLQFPAVTICNNNKVHGGHAREIARKLLMNGFDISMTNRLFSSLMKLIRPDRIEIDNATAAWALDTLGYTVEKLMFELMQPCSELLVRCSWLGQIYNCDKIFKTVKSNEGFCCGFNYHYDLSKINDDSWLTNITMNEEPIEAGNSTEFLPGVHHILRAPGAGRDIGLSVALNIDAANYKSSIRQFIGVNVLVHDPIDYPDVGAQTASLIPGHVMALSLSGTRVTSSENIRNIPLKKRMCLFDGESPGEKKYSYQTCVSECVQRNTYKPCGCLPFFYPDEHPDIRTCYLTDVDCILSRRNDLAEIKLTNSDCGCLPQCNDASFGVHSESVGISNLDYDTQLTHGLNVNNNISFLYVYFGDGSYMEYRTETILGWDNLLASFGGIFGLCLGGSVISFVEFLYYLISELLASRRKKREKMRDENLPPASSVASKEPLEC